ncbi:threonine dehydrogenase-like Zn-dependent dehydrogenase [Haloactinospora alba]|uniref:Threonine dehydrogenase-like Zn-dependent dehydrogenase n=1 Tax=Haloactinospora alba TaxID=405555 RepID=A0A543NNQ7_9ACTN|nr:alcohol dehydrogenase catalytic domain-containing protein [Haloactinospora alba]TQN33461.1 threonine dehydrogenase-like Zn-dependent dehydrogenase [Haloactinospora alba]
MSQPESMTALVLGHNDVSLERRPVPVPGPNDAVIRTSASMMCMSDVHTLSGAMALPLGRILGHESVGRVHRLGEAVTGFREGERVGASAITPCGQCAYCQSDAPQQCGGGVGGWKFTAQQDGSLAEYFLVPDARYNLARIPDTITDEQALYATDSLNTGIAAAEQAAIRPGGTVAVFAQGAVGLSATIGARLLGAGLVLTTATRNERARLSRLFGADHVINPYEEDAVNSIRDVVGEDGVDSAVEALGTHETFEQCVRVTKASGTVVNAGYQGWKSTAPLPVPIVAFGFGLGGKSIRSVLCPGGGERLTRLFRLIGNGRIDPTPMTSHRFRFSEADRAFRTLANREDGILKPLITY